MAGKEREPGQSSETGNEENQLREEGVAGENVGQKIKSFQVLMEGTLS